MVAIVGWILLQAATLPDTIVTKPLAAPSGTNSVIASDRRDMDSASERCNQSRSRLP